MKNKRFFAKIIDSIKQLYFKNKKLFFVTIALVFIAVVVMILPLKSNDSKNKNDDFDNEKIITSTYASQLESKIKLMLLKVSSVSLADVLVMFDSSPVVNYLTQKESTKNTNSSGESFVEKEEIVYEKNGSSQSPIIISTTYPKVSGVLIVINKIDASTKISIQNALAGVLNIAPDCIFILQDR